jgi:hypothetical protein
LLEEIIICRQYQYACPSASSRIDNDGDNAGDDDGMYSNNKNQKQPPYQFSTKTLLEQ